jgi:hypothetical protein
MVDSTLLMGFDQMHRVGKLLILNNWGRGDVQVVVSYIAITNTHHYGK